MSEFDLFHVYDIPAHTDIKDKLLLYFDELTEKHNLSENPSRNISSTDYFYTGFGGRPPYNYLIEDNIFPILKDKFLPIYNCKGIQYQGCWFQQYEKGSDFSYHNHPSSHFAGIYYLELPDELGTQFIDLHTPDIQEGQMIIFPSFLVHKSPINTINERKTVVAFNFNITFKEH